MDDRDATAMGIILEEAVVEFRRATNFAITFGGFHEDGVATVTALSGQRTPNLHGLRVETERGLGGRAILESRPRFTGDYRNSMTITHDYDAPVLSEGITSLFAFPVVVNGTVRALLYGGGRSHDTSEVNAAVGSAFLNSSGRVAQLFARDIAIQDKIRQRTPPPNPATPGMPGDVLEELRLQHAQLRRIVHGVPDPELRRQLVDIEAAIATLGGASGAAGDRSPEAAIRLTPREVDVLTHASLGLANAAIGRALHLTEGTVKSYMKTAMAKLGASTRHEAVSVARRRGIIL